MKNKAHIVESSGDKKAFDVCIMNPPYDRNLHLKILEKVIPHCEETINISPIRWLQDPLAKYKKNSDYNKFKESVAEHIKSVLKFNPQEMADLFGGNCDVSGAIIHCDNDKHDPSKIIKENRLIEKMFNFDCEKMKDVLERDKLNGIRVRCGDAGGNFTCSTRKNVGVLRSSFGYLHWKLCQIYKDGYSIENGKFWSENKLPGGGNKTRPVGTPMLSSVEFKTVGEARNFEKSMKTEFIMGLGKMLSDLSASKDAVMPWMGNVEDGYKSPWDNKRFCDYFKITGYISDTEAEPGSEWEEILKTMEKYK